MGCCETSNSLDPGAHCTLPPEGLEERLSWIERELLPHSLGRERLEDGWAVELGGAASVGRAVDRLIELEAECCRGVSFVRAPARRPGAVRLEVRGVDPDAAIFARLGEAASGESEAQEEERPPPVGGTASRVLAGGLLASVGLGCVLPLAAVAALGSVAAPLAALDRPLPLAVLALAGALGAWQWARRSPDA